MRPLRDTYATNRAPRDPHPSEPVAVLSHVARAAPAFDPSTHGDRAFFGADADRLRVLGPRVAPLCEIAYELLEQASVWFERLGGYRIGVVHAGPSGFDLPAVPRILGLGGPVMSTTDGPSLFAAVHLGAQMIRADEADLVVALAEDGGGVGVCLGRADRAGNEDWRMAGLLSGMAVGHGDPEPVATLAATRAGFPNLKPQGGSEHLATALKDVGEGTGSVLLVDTSSDRAVALVLAPAEPQSMSDRSPRFLGLSARSAVALRALADATAARIHDVTDGMAFATDALRRPAFEHRLAVVGSSVDQLRERLLSWGHSAVPGVASGTLSEPGGVVFVFPPAGALLPRAADRLYETEPTFRDALNRCDRVARPHLPRALLSVLFPAAGREEDVDDPGYSNPLTVALGWSLAELYRSYGIEPTAVVGCGVSELVAAAVAGAVDIERAMRLAVERGRLVRGIEDHGRRAVLGATEDLVAQLLQGEDGVDLVAVPRPGRTIVGGTARAVARFVDRARGRGIKAAELDGSPIHTPLVDPILAEFAEAAKVVEFAPTDISVISTVTGRALTHAGPEHWIGTLRAPLRFADAVVAAADAGGTTFLELAARPTMGSAGEQTLRGRGARFIPALVPGVDEVAHFAEVLALAWTRGAVVDHHCTTRVPAPTVLPSYPFDRRSLDEELPVETTPDHATRAPAWFPDLPEEEVEITLVPADEAVGRSDELLDLGRSAPPAPLAPMFLPEPEADDGMSLDSDPVSDITLDDLRYQGPGRVRTSQFPPLEAEQSPTQDDLLGNQGPVWGVVWDDDPIPEVVLEAATFVILTEGGIGDAVCALLEQAGHRVVRVEQGAPVPRSVETVFVPDPLAEDAWVETLEAVGTIHGTVQLVHLWTAREEDVVEAAGWPSVVALVKEVMTQGLPSAVHLVTSGVLSATDGVVEERDAGAGLWGLAGLLATESELFGGIVDLDPNDPDPYGLASHLVAQSAEDAQAGAFLIRSEGRARRRIVARAEPPRPEAVDASGTWVLGGALDAVTMELATWLASRGVKRVFLIGAAAPPAEVLKSALDLQKKGTACIIVRADAADAKGAETVRQRLSREKVLSGAILRFQPAPCALTEIDPNARIGEWRQSLAIADLLTRLVGPAAPVWAWSEARALDGAPGNAVAACVATALSARLERRRVAGSPSAMVHSGPHSQLPPGDAVRLFTGLCALGGQWGAWLP